MRKKIIFYLNGVRQVIDDSVAMWTLSQYLRKKNKLLGTKIVCEEGDCGACTVLVANRFDEKDRPIFFPVNSCIAFVFQVDLCHILTIEGIGDEDHLSPVQKGLAENFGSQCGYCTPGFVMSLSGFFENQKKINRQTIKKSLVGNLCRCTGYEDIIQSALSIDYDSCPSLKDRYLNLSLIKERIQFGDKSIELDLAEGKVFIPLTLEEAVAAKTKFPEAYVISGATDLGVVKNKVSLKHNDFICINKIKELQCVKSKPNHWSIGAGVTMAQLQEVSEKAWPEFSEFLGLFASPQIKNIATLGGNVMNASPVGDSLIFLLAMNAQLELYGLRGWRSVLIDQFFKDYKVCDVKKDELLVRLEIPSLRPNEVLKLYKVSKRKDLDISTFSAAFSVVLENNIIQDIRIAMGGVAAIPLRLKAIEEKLKGKSFEKKEFENASSEVVHCIKPLSDVRSSSDYRLKLAQNIFLKFYYDVSCVRN